MEFWGVEVESGKPLKVTPEEDTLVHISQASLGECKNKKGETVPLYVKVGNQKLVLGTLLSESIPQLNCDLVFDKEFELSHNWGKGSVYFVGFKAPNIEDGGEYFSNSEEEEEEEIPATITANGNAVVKPKATPAGVKKSAKAESDDDDSDEEGMDVDEDDSDDEEDSEEEKEETPKKKVESSKKRTNEAAPKTHVSAKKAKTEVTPKKTEEKKKGGHTTTPHPAKKGGKTPTTAT